MPKDIHPRSPVNALRRDWSAGALRRQFAIEDAAPVLGMSPSFINRVLGERSTRLTLKDVLLLLDQDSFSETFVPRSSVPSYLLAQQEAAQVERAVPRDAHELTLGDSVSLIGSLPDASIQCVVTSTPYWGMRLYDKSFERTWADGETCPFGNEQTPEGFIRHSVEVLFHIKRTLTKSASVWWNLMDTFNTRTQIRTNAAETLRAMQGKDERGWKDHACRRYSAGHAYLKDGEQCVIPAQVAQRASRLGYYLKSIITWKKNGSLPETVETRVTREQESILHFAVDRAPLFVKGAFLTHAESLGGRNRRYEAEKLTDVWHFSTAAGQDGHGAQFPLALPARCISLSTKRGDLVLDPFVGSGTASVAAKLLERRSVGFDISEKYLKTARRRLNEHHVGPSAATSDPEQTQQATLL